MRRIGILFCSVALLLGALVFPAAAQEIAVADEVAFIQALNDGGTIVLQNDIYLASFVIVRSDVTIDLNGHQILVAEGTNGVNISNTEGYELIIRDSVGTGKIGGGEKRVFLNMESGSLRIEGGFVDRLHVTGGFAELVGGTIDVLEFNSFLYDVTIYKHDEVQVNEWLCQRGTVNFDPTPYMKPGFVSKNNGDGTYTITAVTVEKTGQTISYYYDAYSEEFGKFLLSADGTAPQQLQAEILYVNAGESEYVPMTKCDDGNRWVAEIDRAYIGAEMQVVNPDCGIGTDIFVLTEEGTAEKEETAGGNSQQPTTEEAEKDTSWIWIVVGAGAAVVILAIILLRKKK